jgi:hypothetical protein
LAIGTNLPILASAFETLAEDYIKVNNLTKKYTEAEKQVYYDLIKENKMALELKLENYEFGNRLLNRLQNPFSLGMGEKNTLFLEALGITIAKNSKENKALQARNVMAHSSIENDDESIKKYLMLTHAYTSLFHRILLKIMGFDGSYVDYSTLGYPERKMSENLC